MSRQRRRTGVRRTRWPWMLGLAALGLLLTVCAFRSGAPGPAGTAEASPPLPPGPASATAAAPAGMPFDGEARPLRVPPGLERRSRFEPSGTIWLPELQRYLIVSDDTGWKKRDDHAPWVFTVGADGGVDEEPLSVRGVEQLNDLEGVTRSPDGSIYLLSSQSTSRRGKRPPARELLLRTTLGPGRQLTVTGQVQLLSALLAAGVGASGAAWLHGLGLGFDGTDASAAATRAEPGHGQFLEIEGLAWQDGALLLGLKQPLSPAGEALLWRLTRPDRLLDRGALEPADLTLLARLDLHRGEAPAPGPAMGLSDLCPLPQGGLLLLSTVPGKREKAGAVWRLQPAPLAAAGSGAHALRPAQLRVYPGLKPEGAALGPDGLLTLVFDEGQAAPLWARIKP